MRTGGQAWPFGGRGQGPLLSSSPSSPPLLSTWPVGEIPFPPSSLSPSLSRRTRDLLTAIHTCFPTLCVNRWVVFVCIDIWHGQFCRQQQQTGRGHAFSGQTSSRQPSLCFFYLPVDCDLPTLPFSFIIPTTYFSPSPQFPHPRTRHLLLSFCYTCVFSSTFSPFLIL